MANVFISYRRSDTTSGYASWIYDRLAQTYGPEHVFMDMDSLSLGVDFVEQLQEALSKTDLALVLIGPGWLDATDANGRRRLEDESDFVRIEVGAALRASTRVIPVLIDGAAIPDSTQLPEDLRPLIRRQALTFQRQGGAAINNLLHAIEEIARAESGEAAADVTQPPPPREHAAQAAAPSESPPPRSRRPLALILVALVAVAGIAAGVLAATGGSSSHTSPPAAASRKTTKVKPVASRSSKAAARPKRSQSTPPPVAPSGTTSCGGDLSVGPNTSCSFAQNVEQAYDQTAGGNQVVSAFSPATGITYTIDCSGASPHECTGGTTRGASLFFTSGPGSAPSSSQSIPATATGCGGGVYVGADTSCGFAQNVQRAYNRTSGGNTDVTAFSPATGRTYVISCTGASPHVCTGGTTQGASVYFP